MQKWLSPLLLLMVVVSCHPRSSLTEQLTAAFSNHLGKLDPDATLDSVRIIWNTPVTEKLGRIVDDTIYMWEYNRIKWQLASAVAKRDRDSIAFYRYEIRVMEHELDSISSGIGNADTLRQFGSLMSCRYVLRKNQKAVLDSTMIYLDSSHVLRYSSYLDSALARSLRSIR